MEGNDLQAVVVRDDASASTIPADPPAELESAGNCNEKPPTTEGVKKLSRRRQRALERRRTRDAMLKAKALPLLEPADIVDRLRLYSTGLVEDIHALALRQLQAEDQREARLDAKAQGLLVTSGLSLTVAFTFGGILLQHPEYFRPLGNIATLGKWPLYATVVCYGIALVIGLLASVYAVRALLVTDEYRATSERDVLDEGELSAADDEYVVETSKANGDRQLANARAQSYFRRYMTAHYWQIWQQHERLHERKATIISRGQWLFLGFLSALIIIGIAIGYSAISEIHSPQGNTAPSQGVAHGVTK